MLWAISRAPLPKLQAYKRRMGWSFPWASSDGSDFNLDFHAGPGSASSRSNDTGATDAPPPGGAEFAAMSGVDWATYAREAPGMSAFALEDGVVYHTYWAYERGLDPVWPMYQWLDRAPLGRNETGLWIRRRDEYAKG
jgi:predicted dithiol-disulfide oxidoreductase (DUF899 family)